jgi:hypothetical protein
VEGGSKFEHERHSHEVLLADGTIREVDTTALPPIEDAPGSSCVCGRETFGRNAKTGYALIAIEFSVVSEPPKTAEA